MDTAVAPIGGGTVGPAGAADDALALAAAQERLHDAFFAGRNPRTVAAYRRDLEDFRGFVAGLEKLAHHAGSVAGIMRLLVSLRHGEANALALDYRAALLGRRLAPATVNRRLAALRSVVTLGNVLGLVPWKLAVENVGAVSYRDTTGTGTEGYRALLAAAEAAGGTVAVRDTAILRLLYDVALRRGELVGLDLAHYDARRGTLAVLGKARTQRETLTLPRPTRAALDAWIAARGPAPGPLFHRLDVGGAGTGRLTGAAVYALVRRLGEAAGIRARPHALRHAAITAVLDKSDGDVRAAQRFARHRDPRTTITYDDNRKDLAGQMADLIAGDDP